MQYDALHKLGPAMSFVKDILVTQWGHNVTVVCLYDPDGARQPYHLEFKGCEEVCWQLFRPEEAEEKEAAIIDFALGIRDDRKIAVIDADIFELVVYYGTFIIDIDKA